MWLTPLGPLRSEVFNRSGLQLRKRRDGDFDVVYVYAGSPAAAARIRRGDRITAIDGRPASAYAGSDVAALNTAPIGTLRTYVVARPGASPRTERLRLAELLP